MEILWKYKRKGEDSAGRVYFHWFCTSVFPNSNLMSSQRPIQLVERPNNYAAFHLSLLYLIIIIIIIIYIYIFFFLNKVIQHNTKQYFKLLLYIHTYIHTYIHITIVYKITLTKYKSRECYRLQIEWTLCIIIFLSASGCGANVSRPKTDKMYRGSQAY